MLVLGIETSTTVSSVSLWDRNGPVAGMTRGGPRGHVEFLMPAITRMVAASGGLAKVTAVAVGLGPGLFTSMRVGVATAKSLAQALRVPIVGISSLDALAFQVRFTNRLICTCVDAKRGEVFAALYRRVPGGVKREGDHQALDPDDLAAELIARDEEILFVGDGAHAYPALNVERAEIAGGASRFPRADAIIELALPRLEREEFTSVEQVEPLYVRKSDAEIKWEERGVVIERPDRVKIREDRR
jgi:tRNA threonylcarbamoyladenosine biosynthesis protein TsaB